MEPLTRRAVAVVEDEVEDAVDTSKEGEVEMHNLNVNEKLFLISQSASSSTCSCLPWPRVNLDLI